MAPAPYTYAAVILDASTGEFTLSVMHDDSARTQLETLLVQRRPREVVYEQVQRDPKPVRQQRSAADMHGVAPRRCKPAPPPRARATSRQAPCAYYAR